VIRYVNENLVSLWVDVREQPVPPIPDLDKVLINARMDSRRMIVDPFSEGFFVRTVIVSPDGKTLLNPQASTLAGAAGVIFTKQSVPYAQVTTNDFWLMLRDALARHRGER
jgi:hypothetical protein